MLSVKELMKKFDEFWSGKGNASVFDEGYHEGYQYEVLTGM